MLKEHYEAGICIYSLKKKRVNISATEILVLIKPIFKFALLLYLP